MNPEGEFPAPQTTPESALPSEPAETSFLKSILFGSQGIRVGWLAAGFVVLLFLISGILQTIVVLAIAKPLHIDLEAFTPISALLMEIVQFLSILGAVALLALIERRRIVDYNLTGPRRVPHFLTGLVAGFTALSVLVLCLYAGGWLRLSGASLNGAQVAKYAALWGIIFLLTGFAEEGSVRCYLLFTLTRGVNYWWALGTVALLSLLAVLNSHSNGAGGVYIAALLGLLPCLLLHLKNSPSAGFWQASWLTCTLFGYIHTFNTGETWIGIFSAAAIGFVFCVSIRLTGSAWWAIGFHAAWDWAQTFFYGTADSGLVPKGHYLTTTPAGAVLWSGGTDGPEGSLLVLPTVLLILLALILVYGRKAKSESPSTAAQPQLS